MPRRKGPIVNSRKAHARQMKKEAEYRALVRSNAPRRRVPRGPPARASTAAPPVRTQRPQRSQPPNPAAHKALAERVCSITDPFCPLARGSKVPDGNSMRTEAYQSISLLSVTTNAGGVAATLVAPDPSQFFAAGGTGAGASLAIPAVFSATDNSWTTAIGTNVSQCRVVSAGVRWIPQAADTSAGSIIVFTEIARTSAILGGAVAPPVVSGLGTDVLVGDSRKEYTWVSKCNGPDCRNFDTPFSSSTRSDNWTGLIVQASGPASTNVGTLEIIVNLEFTNVATSFVNNTLPPPPPPQPAALAAAEKVRKAIPATSQASPADFGIMMVEKAAQMALPYITSGLEDLLGLLAIF